jgi:hypothetical protein
MYVLTLILQISEITVPCVGKHTTIVYINIYIM